MNIAQTVLDKLAENLTADAIVEAGKKRVSRRNLRMRILARAATLKESGVQAGDRVVLQERPGIEFAITAVAVLLAGGVLVLAEAGMATAVYRSRVAKAEAGWVLTGTLLAWLRRLPLAARFLQRRGITLPPDLSDLPLRTLVTPLPGEKTADVTGFASAAPRRDSDLAVIVFTGGTTDNPKGVCLTHGALGHYLASIAEITRRHAIRTFVADTPQQILYGLYLGVGVWIPRGRDKRRASHIARCLVRGDAQMFFGPPSIWLRILELAKRQNLPAPTGLRLVMLGGAPVTNVLLQQLSDWLAPDTEITILYGLTEIGPVCTCPAQLRLDWHDRGSLVGSPLPHIDVRIENPDEDGTGELVVAGPSAYSGYLGEPPGDGSVRTGDLARFVTLNGNRQVVLMGRSKDMIIRHGVNIYPAAIEPILLGATNEAGELLFSDCALVGIWNPDRQDEEVVLFAVPGAGFGDSDRMVLKRLSTCLGAELIPDHLFQIKAIPCTGRQQKQDKKQLRQLAAAKLGLPASGPDHPTRRSR